MSLIHEINDPLDDGSITEELEPVDDSPLNLVFNVHKAIAPVWIMPDKDKFKLGFKDHGRMKKYHRYERRVKHTDRALARTAINNMEGLETNG
jgi:hypothetical protein